MIWKKESQKKDKVRMEKTCNPKIIPQKAREKRNDREEEEEADEVKSKQERDFRKALQIREEKLNC